MLATAAAPVPLLAAVPLALLGQVAALRPLLGRVVGRDEAPGEVDVWEEAKAGGLRCMERARLGVTPSDRLDPLPAHKTGHTCMQKKHRK